MATITLLEKARQNRKIALASLKICNDYGDNVVSIFDYAFDERPRKVSAAATGSNVIEFHSARAASAQPIRQAA